MGCRLLHLADLHLDSTYGGRRATRSRLRAATFEALGRAVRFAMHEDLDGVLIAGDAFDDERLGYDARAVFRREIDRLLRAGIPVVYATGNHDPGGPGSRASALQLGGGAAGDAAARAPRAAAHVVLGPEPRTITLARDGRPIAHVVAAGHPTARVTDDLAATFRRPAPDGLPAVAVLHSQVGSAQGADGHARYAPCEAATLRASGFDYWALGHIHVRGQVAPGVPAWYCGSLQGRHAKESGPRGGLVVELDADGLVRPPTFVPFAELEFVSVELPRTRAPLDAPEDVAAATARALADAIDGRDEAPAPAEAVVRVTGGTASSELARLLREPQRRRSFEDAVLSELQATLASTDVLEVELRLDNLARAREADAIARELECAPSALREALRLARAVASGEDDLEDVEIEWSLAQGSEPGERPAALARLAKDLELELIRRSVHGRP